MAGHKQRSLQAGRQGKVLLLGGSGFVGSGLLRKLRQEGLEATALSSKDMDLSDPSSCDQLVGIIGKMDHVVMLSMITPDKSRAPDAFSKNALMAVHLCQALRRQQVRQLILFSSDAVYPRIDAPVSEDTVPGPSGLYGATHLARELLFREMPNQPLLILRPTMIVGAEDSHLAYGLNQFAREAKAGRAIKLFGSGESLRDYILIDDLVTMVVGFIQDNTTGVFNLASGSSISFKELAELVSARAGGVKIESVPAREPVWHRRFDISRVRRAFPNLCLSTPREMVDLIFDALNGPERSIDAP